MYISRYRLINEIYPHLSLEVEVIDGDNTYYVNMDVNSHQEKEEILEDSWWAYYKPLDEVNFEDDTDQVFDVKFNGILEEMLEFWNTNLPKFIPEGWKPWKA